MNVRALFLFSSLLALSPGRAAIPGAWEDFFSLQNAQAWGVNDGQYYPYWDEAGEYAYEYHERGAPVRFFADHLPGDGALIGDYASAGIRRFSCDVYVESPGQLDFIDCSVYANGPLGKRYYYSEYYDSTYFSEAGWETLWFDLGATWYAYDEGQQSYIPVTVDDTFLSSIEEIGFSFFLQAGSTASPLAAIDNVVLEPTVTAPELATSATATSFQLTFTPADGNACLIETMIPGDPITWETVEGQDEITGPSPHTFATPLLGGTELFRVVASPFYTFLNSSPAG